MAKVINKTDEGKEIFGFDLKLDKIFIDKTSEGKALGDFEIQIIGSTSSKDRDNEIVDINGADLGAYQANPVVLASHNSYGPTIGKAAVSIVAGKMLFDITFPPEGDNPQADVYRKLYKGGFMNASSIGFIPTKWEYGNGPDQPYRTFTQWELLEISLCALPSNRDALITARSKGIITEDDLAAISKDIPADAPAGCDNCAECMVLLDRINSKIDTLIEAAAQDEAEDATEDTAGTDTGKSTPHYSKTLFGEGSEAAEVPEVSTPALKKEDIADVVKNIFKEE